MLAAERNELNDKPLYKWVDEKGVVHYGDSIPPQYAKQERSVLNRHGVEVGRLEGEKTDAQRAADAARDQADNRRPPSRPECCSRRMCRLSRSKHIARSAARSDRRTGQGDCAVSRDTLQGRLQDLQDADSSTGPTAPNDGADPMPDASGRRPGAAPCKRNPPAGAQPRRQARRAAGSAHGVPDRHRAIYRELNGRLTAVSGATAGRSGRSHPHRAGWSRSPPRLRIPPARPVRRRVARCARRAGR